jgi:hypothetical protein
MAIERTIDREVREFGAMLEAQLARLIEATGGYFKGLTPHGRDSALRNGLILLWRRRGEIDPARKSLAVQFAEVVLEADDDTLWNATADEKQMLAAFDAPAPTKVATRVYATDEVKRAITERTEIEAPQKLGKECPPCWRCRWFDGWLPLREVRPLAYDDFEVAAACKAIDQRKVEIAHFVRGTYPEELLAD